MNKKKHNTYNDFLISTYKLHDNKSHFEVRMLFRVSSHHRKKIIQDPLVHESRDARRRSARRDLMILKFRDKEPVNFPLGSSESPTPASAEDTSHAGRSVDGDEKCVSIFSERSEA